MSYYDARKEEKLLQDLMQKCLAAMSVDGVEPVTDVALLLAQRATITELMAMQMGKSFGDNADDFKLHARAATKALVGCLDMLELAHSIRGRQLDNAAKGIVADDLPVESNTKNKAKK